MTFAGVSDNIQHVAVTLKILQTEQNGKQRIRLCIPPLFFGEKNQETTVKRKFEQRKEIRAEITDLKIEYFNLESDDAEMRGTIYTHDWGGCK